VVQNWHLPLAWASLKCPNIPGSQSSNHYTAQRCATTTLHHFLWIPLKMARGSIDTARDITLHHALEDIKGSTIKQRNEGLRSRHLTVPLFSVLGPDTMYRYQGNFWQSHEGGKLVGFLESC
jgi:hypothetical protein